MYEDEECRCHIIEELINDSNTTTFIQRDALDFLYQSPSYGRSTSPPTLEIMNLEDPLEPKRRRRNELKEKSTSSETDNS